MRSDEIRPVTTLRFVAALYVFLFHIHLRWPLAQEGSPLHQFFSLGAVGMSLFFILSGFVLAFAYGDGIQDIKKYAVGRFTRIYPVYFLAAIVTIPFLVVSVRATGLSWDGQAGIILFLVITNVLLIQAWFPSTFSFWNNGGSWSISVEAFFYAVLPLALAIFRNRSSRVLLGCLVVLYLCSTLPGLAFVVFPNPPPLPTYYAGPAFRVPEFLIGVIMGLLYARGFRLPRPSFMFLSAATALGLYLLFGNPVGYAYITLNFVAVPLLALIILSAASLTRGVVYGLMTWEPFIGLGKASYSFYAFQAFLVSGLIIVQPKLAERVSLLSNGWIIAGLGFVILATVSVASRELVEVRYRRFLDRRLGEPSREAQESRAHAG